MRRFIITEQHACPRYDIRNTMEDDNRARYSCEMARVRELSHKTM